MYKEINKIIHLYLKLGKDMQERGVSLDIMNKKINLALFKITIYLTFTEKPEDKKKSLSIMSNINWLLEEYFVSKIDLESSTEQQYVKISGYQSIDELEENEFSTFFLESFLFHNLNWYGECEEERKKRIWIFFLFPLIGKQYEWEDLDFCTIKDLANRIDTGLEEVIDKADLNELKEMKREFLRKFEILVKPVELGEADRWLELGYHKYFEIKEQETDKPKN